MTAEIRDAVRRNRKRGVAAAIGGVVVAALIAVVVPALAAVGDAIPPASVPGNVTPTEINNGGQNNDCAFVGSGAPITWRIENPTTSTRTQTFNGRPVTLALEVTSGGQKLKFTVTGAVARDVIVKGGANSAWYVYNPARASDGNLHAPKKSGNNLFQISHTTFCLAQVGTIAGTVFQDSNESGAQDSFEGGQNGWTVSLYASGNPVATTQTATIGGVAGSYRFVEQPLGVEYTVCETPPASSGSWAQTVPTGNAHCTGSGEEPAGHRFTLNTASATAIFGNVPTATATCAAPSGIAGTYEFSVACASKLVGEEFVVSAWTDNGQFVNLHPVDDLSGAQVSIAEKINFTFSGSNQNPLIVFYDDTKPYGDADKKAMKFCLYDPLEPGSEFVFADGFDPIANPVLPPGETSCMIRNTEIAGGTYVANVYTEEDGWRGVV
jgi:hypothetical protein